MSTHTQIIYQIVFSTKNREKCLLKAKRDELYKYINGILHNKNCTTIQINGVEDHLHILIHLHPSIALADLIKEIKISSHKFIKESFLFPDFKGWQDGYGAFTYSVDSLPGLIIYIQQQEKYHQVQEFEKEYLLMLQVFKVPYNEKYLYG